VIKYTKAEFDDSCCVKFVALPFCAGMARTDNICTVHGSTPATACPTIIACVYRGHPNPETYANTPFWLIPVAKLAEKTMTIKKKKYTPTATFLRKIVDNASREKVMVVMTSDRIIRLGYEAFSCRLAKTSTQARFVIVDTERIDG
jgi:hypothetical protein